jgi:hypothetical protein
VFGSVRTIRTRAYYIPDAAIRLFSPQTYFQEGQLGKCQVNAQQTSITLHDGSILEFPYTGGSILPIMLLAVPTTIGLTYKDALYFSDVNGLRSFLSVAEQTNQNLMASQKELLLWHWKLSQTGF